MNAVRFTALTLLAAAPLALVGCHSGQTITRVDPNVVTDVGWRFNDDDARETYQAMVDDAMFRNWINRWQEQNSGHKPIVIVGPVENKTDDYIDSENFTTEWERELLNSDRVRFVAMRDQRGAVRDERTDQQEWSSPETRKKMRNELGSDIMLVGRITSVKQRAADDRTLTAFYKVTLELINLESNEKLWIGAHDIKKIVRR